MIAAVEGRYEVFPVIQPDLDIVEKRPVDNQIQTFSDRRIKAEGHPPGAGRIAYARHPTHQMALLLDQLLHLAGRQVATGVFQYQAGRHFDRLDQLLGLQRHHRQRRMHGAAAQT